MPGVRILATGGTIAEATASQPGGSPGRLSGRWPIRNGEGGIRTPGRLPFNGFQDRRFRPLSHLSRRGVILAAVAVGVYGGDRAELNQPDSQDANRSRSVFRISLYLFDL